ncbi:MAG: chalcone isomerase family protein [Gemmataceae bacterium]
MRRWYLAVAALALGGAGILAEEHVGVPGSNVHYPTPIVREIEGQNVKMVLTGTALRKKLVFNVYAIASYVQEGVSVRSAAELVAVNCPKQLHLVMERNVSGNDMAKAFKEAIRLNYSETSFQREINTLSEFLSRHTTQPGDHVFLTYVPNVGLDVTLVGKAAVRIENVAFARALWEIYLGRNNLGETIKRGLTSRL